MKKTTLILFVIFLTSCTLNYGQSNDKISTIDFVQILNDNTKEAVYYYQNNWEILRKMAIKKEYIHSYQVLEVPISEEQPFQLMLITTYSNEAQYKLREDHFAKLIKERGAVQLLNDKKPTEFRKILFHKDMVRHWN